MLTQSTAGTTEDRLRHTWRGSKEIDMSKFFTSPAAFDVAKADELVWEVFRKRDLTSTSSRYGERISTDKVGARLADIFKANHVMKDRKDLKADPDKAAWPEDIVEEFFGDEYVLHSATTPEEEQARDRIVSLMWEYTSTSITSVLNKSLSETDGYVLLQAKVAKKRPGPGMRGVARPADARFLTTDFELIRDYGVNHGIEAWRRATERFEAVLKEMGYRQPELRLAIAKAVAKEVPSITGVLVHADVKAIAAMEAEVKAIEAGVPDDELEPIGDDG